MQNNYNCSSCKIYDDANCHFCRICGSNVQFDHISRAAFLQTYQTNEKYCDKCGKLKAGNHKCNPIKSLVRS